MRVTYVKSDGSMAATVQKTLHSLGDNTQKLHCFSTLHNGRKLDKTESSLPRGPYCLYNFREGS